MESQNDKATTIPEGFTPHRGRFRPDYAYDTYVTVFFRDGKYETDIIDNFDFEANHTGSNIDIIGYKVKEQQLGTLGPAIGIAATKMTVKHPMDRAEPQPKATRDNPIPIEGSTTNNYKSLSDVLERAYQQAAHGKGRERHAQVQPFDKQPMQTISQLVGSCDGLRYQAIKKIQEAARLDHDSAVRELLGAINYIAGAIIYMESDK